ncbi:MAG: Kelch repeat-containing protein [Clostridiaceae bacterium]
MNLEMPIRVGDFPLVLDKNEVLLFGGGIKELVSDVILSHNLETNEIYEYNKMPYASRGHQTIRIGDSIYLLGGSDGESTFKSVYAFDLNTKTWSQCKDMPVSNGWFGATMVDGKIYVIGGFGISEGYHSSIYIYSPESDNWEEIKNAFPREIYSKGAVGSQAVISYGGKIYNFGGADYFDHINNSCHTLKTVAIYDPKENLWTKLDIEIESLESAGIVVDDNQVYIVGGFSETLGALDIVQIINLKNLTFEKSIHMKEKRNGAPVTIWNDKLYIYGGVTKPLFEMTSKIEIINI